MRRRPRRTSRTLALTVPLTGLWLLGLLSLPGRAIAAEKPAPNAPNLAPAADEQGPADAESPDAVDPRDPAGVTMLEVSPEQVRLAVADLDSDSFDKREGATRLLMRAGAMAVAPLMKAAEDGGPEVAWRAIAALEALAISLDIPSEEAASTALKMLGESRRRFVRDRAESAVRHLAVRRVAQARQILARLGAEFGYDDTTIKFAGRWKGGDAALKYVLRLKQEGLGSITIEANAGISDEAIAQLRRSLTPAITMHVFGTAFLGVGGVDNSYYGGMTVVNLVPDGGAAQAGLMENDIITHIDGKRVKGFDDLVRIIADKKPGDEVELRFIRGGNTLKRSAKLSKRPALE